MGKQKKQFKKERDEFLRALEQQTGVQPSLPQPTTLPVEPRAIVEQSFIQYKSRLLEISSRIKQLNEIPSGLEKHIQEFKMKEKPNPIDVELGIKVKISQRKRQFKQCCVGGWNELMIKVKKQAKKREYLKKKRLCHHSPDFGSIGIVVGILPDGERDAVVYFRQTGFSWVISRRSLERCEYFEPTTDASEKSALKAGDSVMIPHEDSLIRQMQASRGSNAETVILFRESLNKLVCFDNKGDAYVSFDEHSCLLINTALLVKREKDKEIPPATTVKKKKVNQHFNIDAQVRLKKVKELYKNPTWNYTFSELDGQRLKVNYVGYNGEICVSPAVGPEKSDQKHKTGKCFLVNETLIERPQKATSSHQPHSTEKQQLPIKCGTNITISVPRIDMFFKEKRIPSEFHVVFAKPGKFLGFQTEEVAAVKLDKRVYMVDGHTLKIPLEKSTFYGAYKKEAETRELLKVGDDAVIDTGLFRLAENLLTGLGVTSSKINAMSMIAKLVAFDDNADEAILQYETGEIYSVPCEFITAINEYLHSSSNVRSSRTYANMDEEVPRNQQLPTIKQAEMALIRDVTSKFTETSFDITCEEDGILVLTVQAAAVSIEVALSKIADEITNKGSNLLASVVGTKIEITRENSKIFLKVQSQYAVDDDQMRFDGRDDVEFIENESRAGDTSNGLTRADTCDDDSASDAIEQLDEECEANESDRDVQQDIDGNQETNAAQDRLSRFLSTYLGRGTVQHTVRFYKDTKEIVIRCRLVDRDSSSENKKVNIHRQATDVIDRTESGNHTHIVNNFFNPSLQHCVVGNSYSSDCNVRNNFERATSISDGVVSAS